MPTELSKSITPVKVYGVVDGKEVLIGDAKSLTVTQSTAAATTTSSNPFVTYISSAPEYTITLDSDWKNLTYNTNTKEETLRKALRLVCSDLLDLEINPYEQIAYEPEDEDLLDSCVTTNILDGLIEYYIKKVEKNGNN